MTRSELIDRLVDENPTLTRRDAEEIVSLIFDTMTDALVHGERIEIRGFGSFTVREREPRRARNPKSGTTLQIPARKAPFFKTGKELRERVNTI
ncbi:MAG: integration host factor subunit beta [Desulfuromonadia bacterium]